MTRTTLSIAGIAAHTAPAGLTGFIRWFWHHRRNKKNGDPRKEISFAEGVEIVKAFLAYAAKHGVGELQRFTASKVPSATWVSKVTVPVAQANINEAAHLLRKALAIDPKTEELVGGKTWWTLRGRELSGEWIEMKKDKLRRGAKPPEKVLLYLHGGAHFFSSLETHRYQIVRHTRKLGARAFALSQRLAPQYPFPCALHDALAAYLFLISPPTDGSVAHEPIPPENIVISGDSAGGGLALSLLVLLRDLGLPMPAGATLISPWVDLAHSFPSVGGSGEGDYIPPNGFIYRPDIVWPPPPSPSQRLSQVLVGEEHLAAQGLDIRVEIDEQVQMYAHNRLLDHPLVSPVNQGSLGGLPPLYICCGGSELLHDEIIYIAHKAANPHSYPPAQRVFTQYPSQRAHYDTHYPPTKVQLQVFDGGCHVATTLSITSLAKYMFRGVANAGLFFLAAAKAKKERRRCAQVSADHERTTNHRTDSDAASASTTSAVNPSAIVEPVLRRVDHAAANATIHKNVEQDDDSDSDANSESSASSVSADEEGPHAENVPPKRVTATGHLPSFSTTSSAGRKAAHMIRQRVNLHGFIRPLEAPHELDGCTMNPEHIGLLHAGPVRKWLAQRREWDDLFEKDLKYWREVKSRDREKAEREGFLLGQFVGENPPAGSVAGWHDAEMAKKAASSVDEAVGKKTSASMALAAWSSISNKPDEDVAGDKKVEEVRAQVGREQAKEAEQNPAA
ncbi:Alpha/Beta hydrolase fold [Rhodotorula toruloides]|uniref:Alpha/Beta hydrolase fold n=1 Tax=Rhodotorula toruloides TaxID=5286 RepID=A0A0K3CQP9_RHOTO|nr:Alpha/Beta hydrolase fold [Rhodotorula toruloides]PRQ69915.1 Alpha/Beta hydrolase fold [Rhodotorula toruloides]